MYNLDIIGIQINIFYNPQSALLYYLKIVLYCELNYHT